jgi:hypothetical protein
MPDLANFAYRTIPPETQRWLGRAAALVEETGNLADLVALRVAANNVDSPLASIKATHAQTIIAIVHRALAAAELRAPAAAQGAFIPAGNAFDAFAAVGKVLATARQDVLIVDPYMDEKALTDFAPLASEQVTVRLLADQHGHKATLKPAVSTWVKQYRSTRPLAARLAPARTLHDRLIGVDGRDVWTLTQSLNAFAARAHASIVRVDGDTAGLKIAAYETMWQAATPL